MKRKSLLVAKSLLVENFLDQGKVLAFGKIFACGISPSSRKNLCLWITSLIKEKILLTQNFLDRENIIGLRFLKTKSCNKTNASVEAIEIYISKSRAKN